MTRLRRLVWNWRFALGYRVGGFITHARRTR